MNFKIKKTEINSSEKRQKDIVKDKEIDDLMKIFIVRVLKNAKKDKG